MTDQRVLVCGGRTYTDRDTLYAVLDKLWPVMICHGGARGADTLAGQWAESRSVYCEVYPADWKRLGKKAGPARNVEMLQKFGPQLVVAFLTEGSVGTKHMIQISRKAGVEVLVIGRG